MAEPTATGKPKLVIIETQAGPQPQIWYDDGGRFVGCAHISKEMRIKEYDLPERAPQYGAWTLEGAIHFITEQSHAA